MLMKCLLYLHFLVITKINILTCLTPQTLTEKFIYADTDRRIPETYTVAQVQQIDRKTFLTFLKASDVREESNPWEECEEAALIEMVGLTKSRTEENTSGLEGELIVDRIINTNLEIENEEDSLENELMTNKNVTILEMASFRNKPAEVQLILTKTLTKIKGVLDVLAKLIK